MPDPPTVLILESDPDRAERYAEWLGDDYAVRIAADGEAAFWHFDESVEVVLLDPELPDIRGEKLLGQLRERNADCQYALFVDGDPGVELLELDADEYVRRPIDSGELVELVTRLADRNAIEEATDAYLDVLSELRTLERELDADEPESDSRYRSLSSELVGRRRQIESLLGELDPSGSGVSESDRPPEGSTAAESEPIYRRRPAEFYGLWFLAALTYGVGDVLSTVYTVVLVPGVGEANPLVESLLANFGLGGFLLFKLLVFLVLISISVQGARTADRFSYYWPPVLMTLLGGGLTVWNLSFML